MTAPITRIAAPFAWRIPGHDAHLLHSFAHAEQGSALDLRAAASSCPDLNRRAKYLLHALDEERHASLFAERSAALRASRGLSSLGPIRADAEWLYDGLGELRFLAFVVRGESRAGRQFAVHHAWFLAQGRDKEAELFASIIRDEAHHERYAWDLLVQIAGSEKAARSAVRWAGWWEAWRMWRRVGRFSATLLFRLVMSAFYLTLLPFAVLVWVARPVRSGWRIPEGDK